MAGEGRWRRPEEIAGIVVFLAGDVASLSPARTIAVDGGMTSSFGVLPDER